MSYDKMNNNKMVNSQVIFLTIINIPFLGFRNFDKEHFTI